MSHPIFDIDELLRQVADELVEISPQTAVSFALLRRSFEEPTLSSLWKQQPSLATLVKVLPNHTWVQDEKGSKSIVSGCNFPADRIWFNFPQAIEDDPSPGDWTRLRQYASWMRELHIGHGGEPPVGTLFRLSNNSPGGVLCPKLEGLSWDVWGAKNILSFFRLFLSPHLKRVNLYRFAALLIPEALSADFVQIVSSLPTSLEKISIKCVEGKEGTLKDALSTLVCRSGPSLRTFYFYSSLTEAAVHHITQLPNLRSLVFAQGPPQTAPLSVVPPLNDLRLYGQAALPWLHLLALHGEGILQNDSATHANIRETLRELRCPVGTAVDPTFLSSILKFHNLVALNVDTYCQDREGCTFRLTDADMENLVTTLPRLKCLQLGRPCRFNPCNATVASLMLISTHCLDLTILETHFNTCTIVGDMQRLLDGGSGRDSAKCQLQKLGIGYSPPGVGRKDVEIVVKGFKAIFPSLADFIDYSGHWRELRAKILG